MTRLYVYVYDYDLELDAEQMDSHRLNGQTAPLIFQTSCFITRFTQDTSFLSPHNDNESQIRYITSVYSLYFRHLHMIIWRSVCRLVFGLDLLFALKVAKTQST